MSYKTEDQFRFDDSLDDFNDMHRFVDDGDDVDFNFRPPPAKLINNFIAINSDEEDTENFGDENVNNGGFKLPPRLAARLMKNKNRVQEKKHEQKVLQNLENINTANPALIRRETIIVRSKKSKVSFYLKNFVSQICLQPLDVTTVTSIKSDHQNIDQTVFVGNENDEVYYVNWINSVIATSFKIENVNTDITRIINDCILSESSHFKNSSNHASKTPHLPLKDGISSLAYKEIKLMDMLRSKATKLYESERMKLVKEVLGEDLKVERFYIRKDKSIHADVGAKKFILEIFLNYNPLWLKVALETVFGEKIRCSHKHEVHTLVQFLTQKLLSFKALALKKNCKNTTTYFLNENNVKAAKHHILFHFLLIVNFLDVAKRNRLIDHDPCLFRTDAIYKSSRDIIVAFSREYITGIGDIIKGLRNVGIDLQYTQNPIEEFNFTVTKLSIDLRCGVRLARLAEILLLRNDILTKLYFPPNTITRKIHNMELVFKVLEPLTGPMPKTLAPRDICNGFRQKTLQFLDRLIEVYNMRMREIELQQSVDSIIKIQRAFRCYLECRTQRQHFLKLKAATKFVQHAFRSKRQMFEDRRRFLELKKVVIAIQQRFRANCLMKRERKNYQQVYSKIVHLQQVIRSYCLMKKTRREYQQLKQAATFAQRRFRQNQLAKRDREWFLKFKSAAIEIQKTWRGYNQRKNYVHLRDNAILIQRIFRFNQLAKQLRSEYLQFKSATVFVQLRYRQNKQFKLDYDRYQLMRKSAIVIQRLYRTRLQRKAYLELREKVLFVQNKFRTNLLAQRERQHYLKLKSTAIFVQNRFRQNQLFKHEHQQYQLERRSAITIQRFYRTRLQRKSYLELRRAVLAVQAKFRANRQARIEKKRYETLKRCVIFVQRCYRQNKQFRLDHQKYQLIRQSATTIQRYYRTRLQRKSYLELRQNVLFVQAKFRANRMAKQEHAYYLSLKQSTIFVQRRFRQNKQFHIDHRRYQQMRESAILLQRFYKTRMQRKQFMKLRNKVIFVQNRFRANRMARVEQENYLKKRSAAIVIQKYFRGFSHRKQFEEIKNAALVIQNRFRALVVMRQCRSEYLKMKQAALVIQTRYRALVLGRQQRRQFVELRDKVIWLQRFYRERKRMNAFREVVVEYMTRVHNATVTIQVSSLSCLGFESNFLF